MDLIDLEAEHKPPNEEDFQHRLEAKKMTFLARWGQPYNRTDMRLSLEELLSFIVEHR